MEKENIKFTTTELNYLLDIIEQDINDYEEDFGELHRQTLEDIYNKLVNLNKYRIAVLSTVVFILFSSNVKYASIVLQ